MRPKVDPAIVLSRSFTLVTIMVWDVVYELTIVFSLVAGVVALVFATLMWTVLRRSPLGRVVIALTVVMGLFSAYHAIALVHPEPELITSVAKSLTLTAVAVVVGLSIRIDRRLRREATGRGEE